MGELEERIGREGVGVVGGAVAPVLPRRLLVAAWPVALCARAAAMGPGGPPETIGVLRPLCGASIA